MRPSLLNPLFRPVSDLDGVGPKIAKLLARLLDGPDGAEPRVLDLLFHLPTGIIDRTRQPGIAGSAEGSIVTLRVRVDRHAPAPRHMPRLPYRVFVHDDTGELALTFFRANRAWLERTLPVGGIVHVSGRVEWFNGRPSMVHPDYIVSDDELGDLPLVEPVYPLTEGLSRKALQKAIAAAIDAIPQLPEWLDRTRPGMAAWPEFAAALAALHRPASAADLEPETPQRTRLAYDELLADQLALALTRARMRRGTGVARQGDGHVAAGIRAVLPFSLTASQEAAIGEILADLAKPSPMLRLLQGDVGSGKTVVALMAMAAVVESGAQAALMAPTELLARQHYETIRPLAEAAGLRVALLTGRERAKERDAILAELLAGFVDIAIGTHALFQETVRFRDLGLAVVDEQHRFGVQQRLALAAKGGATDVLVMTATPIPRSLVLTYFGDMDVSQLREKPKGRRPVETRIVSRERLGEVVSRIGAAIAGGGKVFWVCPLIEEAEDSKATAAEDRAAALTEALGVPVGLVHGRMPAADKDAAMERFRSGAVRILVATTVIEVGVDVPDATIMVIEHAERFGLAQLHQLRGRIGRGDQAATCLLLYAPPLGPTARRRLEVMRETDDGFLIAEEDLKLRGEGEILGTRQSGLPGFRLADSERHRPLMEAARDDAQQIVDDDPALVSPRGKALQVLLYLFGRDAAIRLLRAG